jgi:superfamily II DNA or RNA helicase
MSSNITTISVKNANSKIFYVDPQISYLIFEGLSYGDPESVLDFTSLYDPGTKVFPTGVISMVIAILKANAIPFEIDDQRTKPTELVEFPFTPKFPLRPEYQVADLAALLKTARGIARQPTGGGKTLLAAYYIAARQIAPVIFYVHRLTLMDNAYHDFAKQFPEEWLGRVGGGHVQTDRPIVIAMIPTVAAAMKLEADKEKLTTEQCEAILKMCAEAKVIIGDEIHHVPSATFTKVMMASRAAYFRIGLCLDGNSTIYTDRDWKKIRDVKIGDQVFSYNHTTNQVETKSVVTLFQKRVTTKYKIKAEAPRESIEVVCSGQHRFYVSTGEYVKAEYLRVGDRVWSIENLALQTTEEARISSVEIEECDEVFYDIEVEDNHNFFVNNLLSHNSATPFRSDGLDLLIAASFGNRIVDRSASELADLGFLHNPSIEFVDVPRHPKAYSFGYDWHTIQKLGVVENVIYNKIVVEEVLKLYEQDRMIGVFVNLINHGRTLLKLLQEWLPLEEVAFIDGNTPSDQRNILWDEARANKKRVLIFTGLADEGLDIPRMDGIVLADGGKAPVEKIQQIGRGLRKHPDKWDCKVIDFYNRACPSLEKHSKARLELYNTYEKNWTVKIRPKDPRFFKASRRSEEDEVAW